MAATVLGLKSIYSSDRGKKQPGGVSGYDSSVGRNPAEYRIYAHFDKTLAYLKNHKVVSFRESQDIKLENLEIYSSKYEDGGPQYISDETQLNELKEHILLGEFMYHRYELTDDYAYGNLRCVLNGTTRYLDVYIKQSVLSEILD